jgi:hypothetical protein
MSSPVKSFFAISSIRSDRPPTELFFLLLLLFK